MDKVELFGCPGRESIELDPIPYKVIWGSGAKLVNENTVLHCGGYVIEEDASTNECFTFNLINKSWTQVLPLLQSRFYYLITNVDSLDDTEPDLLPLAIGD